MFANVKPTSAERDAVRPGDDIVSTAEVVMDRGFTVPGTPAEAWPWLVQLGKWRAGWYLPRSIERFIPRKRRAIRHIEALWQNLAVGEMIPDYGGRKETFELVAKDLNRSLVYTSRRGRVHITWSIYLTSTLDAGPGGYTRVHLRLRLGPVRRKWLAESAGELIDVLTIAGLAVGLSERLRGSDEAPTL